MASQLAEILNSYRQTMPESGAGLRDASRTFLGSATYLNKAAREDQQNAAENEFAQRRASAAEKTADATVSLKDQERHLNQMKTWAAVATPATTPEKWKQYQDQGWLPKELPFTAREPLMMAVTTATERLNAQKEATRQEEWAKEYALKQKTEGRLAAKDAKETGGTRPKIAEEKGIYGMVAAQFNASYDPVTHELLGFKDDASKQKAQNIATLAVRLYKNDPNLSALEAVTEAASRSGIEGLRPTAEPSAPAASIPGVQDYRDYFK